MKKVEDLIKELDVEDTAQAETESISLKHADATEVAAQINRIYRAIVVQRIRQGRRTVPFALEGNSRNRMLLVSGSADDIAIVKQMVEKLDVAGEKDPRETKVFALENADALAVGRALMQMFPRVRGRQAVPLVERVDVGGDRAGNTVVVTAPADELERIAKIVEDMDQAGPGALKARVFKINHADLDFIIRLRRPMFKTDLHGQHVSVGRIGLVLVVIGEPVMFRPAGHRPCRDMKLRFFQPFLVGRRLRRADGRHDKSCEQDQAG